MPISTVGRMGSRLAATSVTTRASRSAGRSDTNAGAITEISTQPGRLSITYCMRGLSVRPRSSR